MKKFQIVAYAILDIVEKNAKHMKSLLITNQFSTL